MRTWSPNLRVTQLVTSYGAFVVVIFVVVVMFVVVDVVVLCVGHFRAVRLDC